ncbi:hypothetical protein [Actinophytocola oryzae]|uniref:Uncharacterized protein n=1 Tax=Actinophytocola oryzae TaxID=502181 RepID=A0A4R7VQV6_9PSEU|nr:hypothetical protein [Actinophytocola oryzae]TDV52064.1 hypothetical protein CLV71_105195 [Actinophytocola oryzae]
MDISPDTTPTRDQVGLYEPRAGVPVTDQPVLHDLLLAPRKSLQNPVRWVVLALLVLALVYPTHPLGIAFPAVLALFVLVNVLYLAPNLVSGADLRALGASPTRLVPLGAEDLLRAGRVVAIRLPDDNRWCCSAS